MLREAGVEVRFGVRVEQVAKRGAQIRSVTLDDGATVAAKTFVDAGYEGDLMARAGVKYAVGREAAAEFGEEAAGIHFEKSPVQAATVDENGKLLPGISGWAKDFTEGDAALGRDVLQLAAHLQPRSGHAGAVPRSAALPSRPLSPAGELAGARRPPAAKRSQCTTCSISTRTATARSK